MALKTIYFVVFVDIFCIGLVIPLIAPYILSNGGSVFLTGVTDSLCAGLQFINAPIVGSWSDTFGRKKVFNYTLIVSMLSNALLLVSPGSLIIFIIARFLNSTVHHVQVLIKAIAVDRIPEKEHVKVFTTMGALLGVGFTFAPMIGGHLYAAHGDFFYIVVITNTLYLACMGAVSLLPEIEQPSNKSSTKTKSGVLQNIRQINWKLLWDVFLVKMAAELAFSLWRSTLILLMREVFNIPTTSMGYFIGYNSVLVVLSNVFMPLMQRNLYPEDKTGTKLVKLSMVLQGIAYILMALTGSFYILAVLCIPLFVGKILLDTVWMKILLNRIKDKDKGLILGASDSIMPFCGFIGPITVGTVGEVFSLSTARYLPLLGLAVSVPIIDKLAN